MIDRPPQKRHGYRSRLIDLFNQKAANGQLSPMISSDATHKNILAMAVDAPGPANEY
jgi:hypothetical protein